MSQTAVETKVEVSGLPSALLCLREHILADLTMLAQIPAPTGEEEQRIRYVLDRFVEAGLPEVGPDEMGNAVGLLPGRQGQRTIMLVAHVDTIYAADGQPQCYAGTRPGHRSRRRRQRTGRCRQCHSSPSASRIWESNSITSGTTRFCPVAWQEQSCRAAVFSGPSTTAH